MSASVRSAILPTERPNVCTPSSADEGCTFFCVCFVLVVVKSGAVCVRGRGGEDCSERSLFELRKNARTKTKHNLYLGEENDEQK